MDLSIKVLTEGGRVLQEHGGSFRSFISQAGNDAREMVELIVKKIPSYRDEATHEVRLEGSISSIFHNNFQEYIIFLQPIKFRDKTIIKNVQHLRY